MPSCFLAPVISSFPAFFGVPPYPRLFLPPPPSRSKSLSPTQEYRRGHSLRVRGVVTRTRYEMLARRFKEDKSPRKQRQIKAPRLSSSRRGRERTADTSEMHVSSLGLLTASINRSDLFLSSSLLPPLCPFHCVFARFYTFT